jgi:hypothetical protein
MSLSDFQLKIAKLIFAINEAEGFALAGGGALILHKVVDRTTNDLDCFGPSREAVDRFWPAIRDALIANGLAIEVSQAAHGFAKLVVSAPSTTESTQIDVGFDPAFLPPVLLSVGRVRRSRIWQATRCLRCSGGRHRATLLTCTGSARASPAGSLSHWLQRKTRVSVLKS